MTTNPNHPSPRTPLQRLLHDIVYHRHLYALGQAIISDAAYDALEEELRNLNPQHPLLEMVGVGSPDATPAEAVLHNPPMLSLQKITKVGELFPFLQKYPSETWVCSDKIDGMALSVRYNSTGVLQMAATRGNGKKGENVTSQVLAMKSIPAFLAPNIAQGHPWEVRGEVYFPISKFRLYEDRFDSYRNAVPGTFGRKVVDGELLEQFQFFAYDLLIKTPSTKSPNLHNSSATEAIPQSYLHKLQLLQMLGFQTGIEVGLVEALPPLTENEIPEFLEGWQQRHRDHHADGMVLRINGETLWHQLGNTAHHPRGSVAFKFTSESAVTSIEGIETHVGRTGKLTFRAKLTPVSLSGASIAYATLHNAGFIEHGGYGLGAKVKITRSGEVIPAIIACVEPPALPYALPQVCPCGYAAQRSGPDLWCMQTGSCPHRDHEGLLHFVKTLEIKGLSDKTLLKLRAAGFVETPVDLFRLDPIAIAELEGMGQRSAFLLVEAIAGVRTVPLATFLSSLGLKGCGAVGSAKLAEQFHSLRNILAASVEDIAGISGWAEHSAELVVESLRQQRENIANLAEHITIQDFVAVERPATPVSGKRICITGALSVPRKQLQQQLTQLGAILQSSVSKETDYLVSNEASGSAKTKAALALGVRVISEEELEKIIGNR